MKNLIFSVLLLVIMSACSDKRSSTEMVNSKAMMLKLPPANSDVVVGDKSATQNESVHDTSKKIIKEGEISFEANNINETRKAIYNSLIKLGGYIAQESETNNTDNNRKEYNISARIPSKNFDRFLTTVSSAADRIDSKNIRIKDVTTEYIDITAQLANKKKLEARYLDLLKQANKMTDMLEIENKLTEIRSAIESTQGQLNYLVKHVNYSSLDISFYTKQLVQDNGKTFGYKLTTAFSGGWDILGTMFFGFIGLWPILIVVIIAGYFAKRWSKKIREGKPKDS